MVKLGADVEQLDEASRTFATVGDQLVAAAGTLGNLSTATAWMGPDGERFRTATSSHFLPELRTIASRLRQLGRGLARQAEQQRATSEGGAPTTAPVVDGWEHTAQDRHRAAVRQDFFDMYDLDRDGRVERAEITAVQQAELWEQLDLNPGPEHIHSGDGQPWIPQGQGHDEEREEILTSYNDGESVLLSVQDQLTGVEARDVILGGGDFPQGAPTKGGGVATDGEFVYLADTGQVYVYRRDDIDAAGSGETVDPVQVNDMPEGSNASFITVRDGQAFVGEFARNPPGPFGEDDQPHLNVFDIDTESGTLAGDPESFEIPYHAQGMAITDDGYLFTTSYGNTPGFAPHDLLLQEFDGDGLEDPGDADSVYDLDYYAEELNIVGDEVWITFETGADEYDGDDGRDHIQKIPLDRLDDH